jgi:mannose-1-phosphate guanylyltransferase
MFVPVILAGGSGERFWPLSRRAKPKQFLSLDGSGRSLLQATVDRLEQLAPEGIEGVHIVTGQMHRALILEQLPDLPIENLIVEPQARDTAAAVLLATLRIVKTHGVDAIIGIFPSDHRVGDPLEFHATTSLAIQAAQEFDAIVTIGMRPEYPATGYGYIEAGEASAPNVHVAKRFVEKPSLEVAETYLARGGFYWNAGMFIFKASVMLEAFQRHAPDVYALLEAATNRSSLKTAFESLRKVSIDYAIMEPSGSEGCVLVVPARFQWDDLGFDRHARIGRCVDRP